MRMWWLLGLAACGRIGFDASSSLATGDAAPRDTTSPADAAPCTGTAMQLPIDVGGAPEGSWVSQFRASPIDQGFGLSYVAPDAVAFALTFGTAAGVAPIKADTQIVANAASIQPLGVGGALLLETTGGGNATIGPFSKMLAVTGSPTTRTNRTPALRALAASGGALAYVDFDDTTGRVDARPITAAGADAALPHTIDAVGEMAAQVSIAPAPAGFVVTWLNTAGVPAAGPISNAVVGPPRRVRGELLGPAAEAGVPVDIGPQNIDQLSPSVASGAGLYLFAWNQVVGTDSQVWAQFADATLALVGTPLLVGHGGAPKVASDGASFWVVWPNATSLLSGAHVTTDHAFRGFDVAGTGGMAVDFDLIELGGTAELLWFERGGSGHPLWFVPACTL